MMKSASLAMQNIPVAITGIGAVTPVGSTATATFDALCAGTNGIREIPPWKEAGFPVWVAGVVERPELFERESALFEQYRSRKAIFAVTAVREALAQAGDGACRNGRGGIFLGVETGRIDINTLFNMFTRAGTPKQIDPKLFGERSFRYLSPGEALSKQPYFLPAMLARVFELSGEIRSLSNACSSANQAIGEAYRKVATGALDWAITGGSDDMIDEYMAIGFHLLGALSTGSPPEESSRPFDARRKGFVLGEGAGMLIFESLPHALARGAKPLALITGYGSGASASKITETSWEGIHQTMAAAVAEGGLVPADIDYINAHGTGTPMNDPAETQAIRTLFGDRAANIPISSTKSMTGHLIAAAGAVEAVVCALSISQGRIHPTRNLTERDSFCTLDYVPEGERRVALRNVLSNSLGFAGINSTLLFSRDSATA